MKPAIGNWLIPLRRYMGKKSSRHVAMVAKFMDLNKPWSCKYGGKKTKKLICITFLWMIALRNKTLAHTFLPSLDNANGRICQERKFRSRDFVTMVTWRHTSPFHWENYEYHVAQNWISDVVKFPSTKNIMFSCKFQGTLCIRETSMKRGAMRESKDLFILDKGLTIYVVMRHSMNNPLPIIGESAINRGLSKPVFSM